MKNLYTQAEVAKIKGVAPSTLNGLIERYNEYMPRIEIGTAKFYPGVIFEILDNIEYMIKNKHSKEDINNKLKDIYDDYVEKEKKYKLGEAYETIHCS